MDYQKWVYHISSELLILINQNKTEENIKQTGKKLNSSQIHQWDTSFSGNSTSRTGNEAQKWENVYFNVIQLVLGNFLAFKLDHPLASVISLWQITIMLFRIFCLQHEDYKQEAKCISVTWYYNRTCRESWLNSCKYLVLYCIYPRSLT